MDSGDEPRRLPTPTFVKKWVRPFYRERLWDGGAELIAQIRPVYHEIDRELVTTLLSYREWRSRWTGAVFAAVKCFSTLDRELGKLLIQSEVVFAGRAYCVALARFNTMAARQYLGEYLDQYLTRPDLWFDQAAAMGAIGYLDRQNGTTVRERYLPLWKTFVSNKPNWNLAQADESFGNSMATIIRAAQELGQ